MSETACKGLQSCATRALVMMIEACVGGMLPSNRRCIVGEIATRLGILVQYLGSLPPYWIDPDIEKQCKRLLKDLLLICIWPRPFPSKLSARDSSVSQCFHYLDSLLGRPNHQKSLKNSIVDYFRDARNQRHADAFNEDCLTLCKRLGENDMGNADSLPESAENLDRHDCSVEFSDDLFLALEQHSQCNPGLHETDDEIGGDLRHSIRLNLSEHDREAAYFDIFVASLGMSMWQELRLEIRPDGDEQAVEYQLIPQRRFCTLIERDVNARFVLSLEAARGDFRQSLEPQSPSLLPRPGRGECLSHVLRSYQFSPGDRIILSYAIARAYWQLYDSEFMRTKWSGETIWFMPEEDGKTSHDQLPLRSYLSFPINLPGSRVQDIVSGAPLTHQCPRIFAIGLLLLEIGLSHPLPTVKRRDDIAQTNFDHRMAKRQLEELKGKTWAGFENKAYFDEAVGYCLDSSKFVVHPSPTDPLCTSSVNSPTATDARQETARRRKIFYRHVVRPLAWLAKKGFGSSPDGTTHRYIRRKDDPPSPGVDGSILVPEASFHAGKIAAPRNWMKDLKFINADVEMKRRKHSVRTPIRVAILDTGFSGKLPSFVEDTSRIACIKKRRDFVDPSGTAEDVFGHGTFMAKLVMECAPSAEIIIGRIATTTKALEGSEKRVAEAIVWAGSECRADIISMSFGFPVDHQLIKDAIAKVHTDRDGSVIFLASAGNSPLEYESFPARHPSVISIYATNCYGTFAESNAKSRNDGPAILGTFGDGIPDEFLKDISAAYPKVCQPGSSVATAVAAGMGATLLAYTSFLMSLDINSGGTNNSTKRVFRRLWESQGIEAVFKGMATETQSRKLFVNPVEFWMKKQDDFSRQCAIHHWLQEVDITH